MEATQIVFFKTIGGAFGFLHFVILVTWKTAVLFPSKAFLQEPPSQSPRTLPAVLQIPWADLGHKDHASILAADRRRGGLWIGFFQGGIVYLSDGQVRASYTTADGLGAGRVGDILFDDDGTLWISTEGGFSRLKNNRVATLSGKNGLPCDMVHSAIEADDRSFWLYTACGLVRITRSELDAWSTAADKKEDESRRIQVTTFDSSDGITGLANPDHYHPVMAKTTDGKLWFVPQEGVSVIDPHHLPFNKIPPPVHIEQITADGKTYSPANSLQLPSHVRDLAIDYTALSFVAPEKIHFRYKLEGQDPDWREVVNDRQVQYSNLAPRHYTFRVMACNNSGVWNEAGASLEFSVLPAFYQTNGFRVLCAAVFLALLWSIYQLRIQQMQHQFNIALDARVNERTRIARELHDTLLQNFHGLMFQFQAASNLMLRKPDEAKRSLDDAISETKKALADSRDAIQDLRSEPIVKGNLAELLMLTSRELADSNANEHSPVFDLIEEGERQALSSTVSNDVCRIALELMRNAYQHALAQRIEAEIRYGDSMFRLRIRDNGRGIDPKMLKEGGRAGHWGLRGLRERAERIGAHLDLWSEPGNGTEVELVVPASIAYQSPPASYRAKLLRKVKPRA
jgi:signal transduction histidine kinase